ncbi:MAG: hypothetical protein ACYDCF_08070 [Burkholderiales bacterium]
MVDKDLRTSPGARRSDRLFFVANTGNRAHVTHDVEDVREVLRWRGGRGGRVFVMRATADCSRLVTDAPEAVKQSVRLFMYALSHGKGVTEAEAASRVVLQAVPVPEPDVTPLPSSRPAPRCRP